MPPEMNRNHSRSLTRTLGLLGLGLVAVLGVLWLSGALQSAERAIVEGQKQVQTLLAGAVRRLRGGQPGALLALLGACFAYGFLHAAGPGHGKLVIGSFALAGRTPLARLSLIAVVSSLAQSAVAVALVGLGFLALGWGRDQTTATAQRLVAPIGALAIAAIGLWLVFRGLRQVWQRSYPTALPVAQDPHSHDHSHAHDHSHPHIHGPECGHAHAPSLEQVQALTSWREAGFLVAGIAMRPCSGALLVLILCFQLGIAGAGVAGAFAMGAGTACVTLAVAVLAIWGREGAMSTLSETHLARALPYVMVGAGLLVLLAALAAFRTTI